MRASDPLYDAYLKLIKQHKITIELDQGNFRSVLFSRPKSSIYYFRLNTWPGHLAISGDMGDLIFQREVDMFTFFRSDGHWRQGISLEYWAEKVQTLASRQSDVTHSLSSELYREAAVSDFRHHYPQGTEDRMEIWKEFREECLYNSPDSVDEAHTWMMTWTPPGSFDTPFWDFYEHDLLEPKRRFKWLCIAIQWGIWKYDLEVSGRTQEASDKRVLCRSAR